MWYGEKGVQSNWLAERVHVCVGVLREREREEGGVRTLYVPSTSSSSFESSQSKSSFSHSKCWALSHSVWILKLCWLASEKGAPGQGQGRWADGQGQEGQHTIWAEGRGRKAMDSSVSEVSEWVSQSVCHPVPLSFPPSCHLVSYCSACFLWIIIHLYWFVCYIFISECVFVGLLLFPPFAPDYLLSCLALPCMHGWASLRTAQAVVCPFSVRECQVYNTCCSQMSTATSLLTTRRGLCFCFRFILLAMKKTVCCWQRQIWYHSRQLLLHLVLATTNTTTTKSKTKLNKGIKMNLKESYLWKIAPIYFKIWQMQSEF